MLRSNRLVLLFSLLVLVGLSSQAFAHWTGTIEVWDFPRWAPPGDPDGDMFYFLREKIREFEEMYPGVNIELVELAWSGGDQKLDVAVASGNYPDVASRPMENLLNYIRQGAVEPITPYLTEEDWQDLYETALEHFTYEGEVYAWPWFMTTTSMFINLDLFEERGVTPPADGVWTWDEFLASMKALTFDRDGDGRIDVYGLGIPGANREVLGFVFAEGGRPLSEDGTEFTFNAPEAIRGFQKLYDLIHVHKVAPPHSGAAARNDVWEEFMTRQTLAAIPADSRLARELESSGNFRFAAVEYPQGDTGRTATQSAVTGYAVFKQEDPAKRDMVMEFVRYVTSAEQQYRLAEYGVFPSRRSASDLYVGDEYYSRIARHLEWAVAFPAHPNWSKINARITPQLELMLLGRLDPQSAMDQVAREVAPLLAE